MILQSMKRELKKIHVIWLQRYNKNFLIRIWGQSSQFSLIKYPLRAHVYILPGLSVLNKKHKLQKLNVKESSIFKASRCKYFREEILMQIWKCNFQVARNAKISISEMRTCRKFRWQNKLNLKIDKNKKKW